MDKKHIIIISCLSGLLMAFSWAKTMMFAPVMLFALIPLLFIEDYISTHKNQLNVAKFWAFRYSYPAFFLFTFPNTWWICNASLVALAVPIAEAAFMSVVFQMYSYTKNVAQNKSGTYFFLVFFWIAFEWIQFQWDLNFPWLNLGNTFASYPILVQWYSITGTEGGSLWVLLCNIFAYLFIKQQWLAKKYFGDADTIFIVTKRRRISYLTVFLGVLVLPAFYSVVIWFNYDYPTEGKQTQVVVVQPNLDPYEEQYVLPPSEVVKRVENLSENLITDSTDYIILPESCIQEYAWEDELDSVRSILQLRNFVSKWENTNIIAGMSTKKMLPMGVKSEASRVYEYDNRYNYESCNTGILIDCNKNNNDYQIRHKSILVVGVEKVPFKKYLSFMEKIALDMGGTVGSLGVDKDVILFNDSKKNIVSGVPICWESIDGNYVRKMVKKGAGVLFVITNVGWWGDTPGYRQYFAISSLRTIENRRFMAISANTGYSGLISPKGEVLIRTPYYVQTAFKTDIPITKEVSFFSRNGDIIMRPMTFFAVMLLAYSFIKKYTERIKK